MVLDDLGSVAEDVEDWYGVRFRLNLRVSMRGFAEDDAVAVAVAGAGLFVGLRPRRSNSVISS